MNNLGRLVLGFTLAGSRSASRPPLFCYTTSTIVSEGQPSGRDRVEVLSLVMLPMDAYAFTLDGQSLLPAAVGRDEEDPRVWVLLRVAAHVGTHDLGQLAVASSAATGSPFAVTTSNCQDVFESGRLVRETQTLIWKDGILSEDPFGGVGCGYDNGQSTFSIP